MKSFKGEKLNALVMVLIVLGIVFFVIFSVYKNLDKLGSIRSITAFNRAKSMTPGFEGFSNYGRNHYINYSTYPDNKPIDSKTPFLIEPEKKPSLSRIWGFSGVYGDVGLADKTVDAFYNTKTDPSCAGSILHKGAGGNVCLDKNQTKLLTSRGGNASIDATIG